LSRTQGIVGLFALVALSGCDTLFTEAPPAGEDFESALDGLSDELRAVFAAATSV